MPEPATAPRITLAVSCWNSAKTIRACVESLLNTDYPNKEVIVVDDGSTDDTLEILEGYDIKLIHQDHKGVSAGRNNAYLNSTGEFVAYTDSDCQVSKDWVKELLKPFESPQVGAVTGRTIFATDHRCASFVRSLDLEMRYEKRSQFTSLANGTNCVFRKTILDTVGGFDPHWFHAEDTEVSYRILDLGYKIWYNPNCIVNHVPEGDWRTYLRKRYRGTKAHMRIVFNRSSKIAQDDFVSLKMKLQPALYPLCAALLVLTPAAVFLYLLGVRKVVLAWVLATALCAGAGFTPEVPLIWRVFRRSGKASFLLKSSLLLAGKIFAIGFGLWVGLTENFLKRGDVSH